MGRRECGGSRRACWLGEWGRCRGMWGSSWLLGGIVMGLICVASAVVMSVFLVQNRVVMGG
jgi:hypothetical protein